MNKKLHLRKLNQAGFDHAVVLVITVVLVGVAGTYLLIRANAARVYSSPFRTRSYSVSRIDQGVDYSGNGVLVYPIGSGWTKGSVVHDSAWNPGGTFIRYQLDGGPDAHKFVYVAEQCSPRVALNNGRVSPGKPLCQINGSNGIEMGWAQAPSHGTVTLVYPHFDGYHSTKEGVSFNSLMTSLKVKSGYQVRPITH